VTERDPTPFPKKFYVAEIVDGKLARVLPGEELGFEQARLLARMLTRKFEPVAVSHINWLQERRENNSL
jgi:hypothetical protein